MATGETKEERRSGEKLIGMADVVIAAAQRAKDPTFAIPIRALSNVSFNPRKGLIEMGEKKQARSFFNVGMAKKFMQTMLVADALSELQRADLTTSLREIYYRTKHTIQDSHENTFDTQDESDPIIEDLEVSLVALREELHVRAENSGSIVGPVVFGDDGDRVDCAKLGKGGYSVPSIVEPEYLEIRRCTADFLLLGRKRHPMEPAVGRQVLATLQLRAPDRQRPAAARRSAAGATAARRVSSSRSTCWSTTIPGDTTSTRWSSRARSTWRLRASAWRFPRPSSSASRAPIPSDMNCHAMWASS